MEDARKRRIDVVLVWRFDRFARSVKHLVLALDELRSLGVQFTQEPVEMGGVTTAVLDDTCGNLIQIAKA